MTLSRRSLLKLALAGAAVIALTFGGIVSQAFAAPGAGTSKFLLVFLRGGYDAANVVRPDTPDAITPTCPSSKRSSNCPHGNNCVLAVACPSCRLPAPRMVRSSRWR